LDNYQYLNKNLSKEQQMNSKTTTGKEQKKENTTKEVLISDKTNKGFIPILTQNIDKIDSTGSNFLFNLYQKLGCASFVNAFSNAVDHVDDAWKSRDTIEGTMIYDVFVNLTPEEIQEYVNIWNRIYSRSGTKKWIDRGSESGAIKKLMAKLIQKKSLNPAELKIGDICGIYYPPSWHHEEAFFEGGKKYFTDKKGTKGKGNVTGKIITSGTGWTFNTHLGIVGAIEKNKPVIIHAIPGFNWFKESDIVDIWADGIDKIRGGGQIVWVERPSTQQSSQKL
jgi:hypothetical protein